MRKISKIVVILVIILMGLFVHIKIQIKAYLRKQIVLNLKILNLR